MPTVNETHPVVHPKGATDSKILEPQHSNYNSLNKPHYATYDSNSQKTAIPSVNSSSTRDTFFVFLTLTFISITLYFTFFLWRKHRQRPIGTIYKLEEYRYSRLSQNELEVDSVVFYGDASNLQPEVSQNSDEEDVTCKPATLHVETVSNCQKSNGQPPQILKNNSQPQPPSILLQDSDEDLLQ